jgi:hypothetical protein
MDQHPIPQDISTYQFRLVGDMTLKQFFELGGGVLMAVLLFNSHFPFWLKWPLLLISALGGVALAFLPFEERPLDLWVKNFFRAVYSPTQYLWKKQEKLPDFFTTTFVLQKAEAAARLTPEEKAKFAEYLKTLPKTQPLSTFDKIEAQNLAKINNFLQTATQINPVRAAQISVTKTAPVSATTVPSVRIRKLKQETAARGKPPNIPASAVPITPMVEIAQAFNAPLEIGTPFTVKPKVLPVSKKKYSTTDIANVASRALPIPAFPEIPNVVVGMVLNPSNRILPGVIIEIRDKNGMPVRASKTNNLGQFFIVTPLPKGEYELEAESDGYSFDIIKFKTEGKIIPPIKIKAKK